MSDQLMGLLNSEADVSYRGGLLPLLRRVIPDIGGDDISEFEGPLELATPALAYDPVRNMALTGAMLRGHIPVNPDLVTQTLLDTSVGSGLLSGATGAVPRGAVLGANVFHGGPHRWSPEPDFPHGRPRLDKIGTGEGAQAYGYGFYSADAPGVATQYRDDLTTLKRRMSMDGEPLPLSQNFDVDEVAKVFNVPKSDALVLKRIVSDLNAQPQQRDIQTYIDDIKGQIDLYPANDPLVQDILAENKKLLSVASKYKDRLTPSEGTLYKLDIPDADVAKYLDYDKPLSEQPKSVRDALGDVVKLAEYEIRKAPDGTFEVTRSILSKAPGSQPGLLRGKTYSRARELAEELALETIKGEDIYHSFIVNHGSDQAASEALRKAGIPGLKYFDGGSRAGGEGTRNYVTWDQDVLNRSKMLERDGVTLGANKSPTAALPGLLDDTASRMQRARDMGFDTDTTYYHGTTHDFDQFGGTTGNVGGHFGAGHYATDNPIDASKNYAGVGPDLTGRIENRAERIAQEVMDDRGVSEEVANRYGRIVATRELKGQHEGAVLPLVARGKTADITGDNQTFLEYNYGGDFNEHLKDARADLGAKASDDEVLDRAYEYQDDYMMSNEPTGELADFIQGLRNQEQYYNFDADEVIGKINERAIDGGMTAMELDDLLRKSDSVMYAESMDTGDLVGNEIIRNAFNEAGFENIVMDASVAFPHMKNIPMGTKHIITSNPANLRSRFAKFDPAKADSADLLAANPVTAALPGLLEQQYMEDSERLLRDSQGLLGATQRRQNQLNALQQFYASGGV